jgi:regulator of sigma E protease
MTGFISFFVVFSLLIFVHELGHLLAAKLAGVAVEEFGFGYPPRLLSLGRWRGTLLTINLLPFGGFVRMNEDDPSVSGGLANKPRWVRALVFSAGALMNLVLAIVLFSATFLLGAPTQVEGPGAGIYVVAPGSPAQQVGMAPGDTLVAVGGIAVRDVDHAIGLIQASVGAPVEIQWRRDGRLMTPVTVTPRREPPPNEGALGVALGLPLERQAYPLWQAVPLGVRTAWDVVASMYGALRGAIAGEIPFEVSGPVGIYQYTVEAAKTGLARLLEFTGLLSVNLFLLNLLPLPALDGGRLVFVLLEWVRGGRRVPPEKEGMVHFVGMVVLVMLMVLVTYVDVRRLLN